VAATVAEELGVPVKRIGAPRIPVGYSKPLEDEARLTADKILAALVVLGDQRAPGRHSRSTT
jgi:pyruvate dehydrogenase E1 component beta subunit